MAYVAPAGHAADLALGGAYAPAPGGAVPLALGDGAPEPWPPPIRPGLYLWVGAPWAEAEPRRREVAPRHVDPPRQAPELSAGWAEAERVRAEPGAGWSTPPRVRAERGAGWGEPGEALRGARASPWRDPPPIRPETRVPWGALRELWLGLLSPYTAPPARRLAPAVGWDAFERLTLERGSPYRDPTRHRPYWRIPWDRTRRVHWEERWAKRLEVVLQWQRLGPRPPDDFYAPPPGDQADLAVRCPLLDWPGYAVWLFLRRNPCPPGAPRRRAWFIMNSVHVVRLPDRTPVPVLGVALASDFDSWCWGLTLTLPDRQALELVSPAGGAPVEVEVTVNGYVWTALVESFEERREFGRSGYTVTGRSRSAYLAAPYAAPRSYVEAEARTAAQLAEAEVLPAGWEVLWEPPDWLVPAGAWSYQGLAPLDALALVAGSVGARVQTHRTADTLRVVPRYPLSPWEWAEADPDVLLSGNLVQALALRWTERPPWNGVYVSGQGAGVLVNVKRTGTDGEPRAPLIVDPLCTHVDAGRERGRIVLAAAGKGAVVTLSLPLLPSPAAPGLLLPGHLVEVDDGLETWRGLVTGTDIEAGRPTVRQRVEIERRYP